MKLTLRLTSLSALLVFCSIAHADDIKIAYLPCGQINDHSWSQAGYEGVTSAKDILAKSGTTATIEYSENVAPAQVEAAARDYAARGDAIVVLHCGTFGEAAVNAAKAFPNTTFLLSTAPPTQDTPPNFWGYDASQQEATFIAGALGSLMSKNGKVGAIGGFAFPALTRQIEGFLLGARYANPAVETFSVYINSWDDAGKAREAAQAQIDSGADVLFAATDLAAHGVFAAAEDAGGYAIASYSDQASVSPKSILVSVIYDFSPLVRDMVVNAHDHKLTPGKLYKLGVADGMGTLVSNPTLDSAVPADVKAKIAAIVDDIKAGRLKVPEVDNPGDAAKVDLHTLKSQ